MNPFALVIMIAMLISAPVHAEQWTASDILVSAPTRFARPKYQCAANVTVIGHEEIGESGARTLAELLEGVSGVDVKWAGGRYDTSLITIQGSEQRHVRVIFDDIPFNMLSDGHAEVLSIPVEIIERIEIIKGPASSVHGSALGGLVKIYSRDAGYSRQPSGSVEASVGEADTMNVGAGLEGVAGLARYIAHVSQDESKLEGRGFSRTAAWGKVALPLGEGAEMVLSAGYSDPRSCQGEYPSSGISSSHRNRTMWYSVSTGFRAGEWRIGAEAHRLESENRIVTDLLNGGSYQDALYDEESFGGSIQGVYRFGQHGRHALLIGGEYSHGDLEQEVDSGPALIAMGISPEFAADSDSETWATFTNATFRLGRLTLVPGIRYDRDSITGGFISPSVGATWRIGTHSLIRAQAARGFGSPALAILDGGGSFLLENPDLEPETVWSYQVGMETSAFPGLNIAATVFRHETRDELIRVRTGDTTIYENDGDIDRTGCELTFRTLPWRGLSFSGGVSYTHISPESDDGAEDPWSAKFAAKYRKDGWLAKIAAIYNDWDLSMPHHPDDFDVIWNAILSKEVKFRGTTTKLFVAGHNIFSGSNHVHVDAQNPKCWFEAGIKLNF